MNLFQTLFPLAILLVISLVCGWLIPQRRLVGEWLISRRRRPKDPFYDIDAVLLHHRQALEEAREAARQALKAARQANRGVRNADRELKHLVDLHEKDVELRSKVAS
jgi:hypothetical protein